MIGFLERMKRWFSSKRGHSAAPGSPKRCSLGPAEVDAGLALAGAGASAAGIARASLMSPDPAEGPSVSESNRAAGGSTRVLCPTDADAPAPTAPASRLDPLDPAWMSALEELPARIAESVAERAAGTESLERIAGEMEGHRQATRAIAAAVRRLPDLAVTHVEAARETNKLLGRQALVLESMLDGLTGLRAALKTVEESSRRNLKAIGVLESSHRQILFEYQTMFLRAHRRLGWLASVAVILAAGAIAALAYVAWMAAK
jgi:hypothetical protein